MTKSLSFSHKAHFIIVLCVLCTVIFSACKKGSGSGGLEVDRDTSYAFGMFAARQMADIGFIQMDYDYKAFTDGFKSFNEGTQTRFDWDSAMDVIMAFITKLESQYNEEMLIEGQKNLEEGEAYLAQNALRSGVGTTPSGLQYEIISEGSGEKPGPNDNVRVHYEGTFINGSAFDSSFGSEPVEFGLSWVIPGWSEGLQLMNEGSVYRLVIPSYLAYGSSGSGPIPPNATLIFRVELLAIVRETP